MKMRRKYNLRQIGKDFETLDIEVQRDTASACIAEIEKAWQEFKALIKEGMIG